MSRKACDVLASKKNSAGAWFEVVRYKIEQGTLTRTIRTDYSVDVAPLNRQIDSGYGHHATEMFGEVYRAKHLSHFSFSVHS
jgi:hypothetical protein